MPRDARKYLHDIDSAAALIAQFTAGKSFKQYRNEPMLRAAVERQFEIIGEALSQLAKYHPKLSVRISEHRRIVAFRNILIHRYTDVDDRLVWDVVETKLPTLRQEIETLLRGGGAD